MSHRSTTSDTNFWFWHEHFTNYPVGIKVDTMQFLPKKNKEQKEKFLKSEKLIDKKFYMKKPKRFLKYYTAKYELERASKFIKT